MLFKCIRRKRNRFLPISQEVSPISDPGEVWGGIESGDGAVTLVYYSRGTSSSPSRICSMRSCGSLPSTVHPTDCAVPKISRIVPERSRAPDRGLIVRAMEIMSSIVMLPLCETNAHFKHIHLLAVASNYDDSTRVVKFELPLSDLIKRDISH